MVELDCPRSSRVFILSFCIVGKFHEQILPPGRVGCVEIQSTLGKGKQQADRSVRKGQITGRAMRKFLLLLQLHTESKFRPTMVQGKVQFSTTFPFSSQTVWKDGYLSHQTTAGAISETLRVKGESQCSR